MEAIILAGGFGKRLKSLISAVPKPLAPVAGRPFLSILLENLARQGFSSVILSVGYMHEMIVTEFGDHFHGIRLSYVIEDEPLGTGGAIKMAAGIASEQQLFVLNGDTYAEMDYQKMLAAHHTGDSKLTVCAVSVDDSSRYGSLVVEGRQIVGFREKGVAGPGLINAGVYVLDRNLFQEMSLPKAFSFEQEILMAKVDVLRPHVFCTHGLFIDIGIPQDYERAQAMLKDYLDEADC